ncbi:hypothetical protein HPB51_010453 [Rhipicephalus microplus]|uniref:CCHC-type domain-containing protein n=1 Tax=Rhipicephalus microplus TaxID=6941 RepID=A0A9J6DZT6_RHIMP|nr:hypothetical protein HPB51_010453 [Rhipicephalus microplus]
MAATLTDKQAEEDFVYLNKVQNIIAISTPVTTNAKAYATIRRIHASFGAFEVSAYAAAPKNTCKRVLRNIHPSITEPRLNQAIVNSRNPTAIGVKRIKNTRAVVVLFEGSRVLRHVACGSAYMECSLYRRPVDICYACGQVGHSAGVCRRFLCGSFYVCAVKVYSMGHRANVCKKSKEEKEKCHNCGMKIPESTRETHSCDPQMRTFWRRPHLGANSSSRARSCSTEASRCRERERSRGRSHQQRSPRGSAGSRSRSGSKSDAKLTWANKVRSGSSSSGDNNGARHEPLPSTPFRGSPLPDQTSWEAATRRTDLDNQLLAVQRVRDIAEIIHFTAPSWAEPPGRAGGAFSPFQSLPPLDQNKVLTDTLALKRERIEATHPLPATPLSSGSARPR